MGCATSKQPVCRNCRAPVTRSYSMHVHHPPQCDGDTYHVVSLTSTTLGYLQHNLSKSNDVAQIRQEPVRRNDTEKKIKDFEIGVVEAKTWSKMIDEKITKVSPKTPIRTPPGEPEIINLSELMEGLDDTITSPLRPPSTAEATHFRSFSFHVNPNSIPSLLGEPFYKSQEKDQESEVLHKQLLPQMVENDSEMNSKEKSMEDSLDIKKPLNNGFLTNGESKHMSIGKEKLILYFTSLRGVRQTFEDCCQVRVILKGTGVRIDERDLSMHSGFKDELKELLKDEFSNGGLPKVFVGKKYIGGAEEIRRFHEDGGLDKVLECCEMADDGGCEDCGDIRFVPCETCCGSCKIYYEEEEDDEEEIGESDDEIEESNCGFKRCPDCNENGLIRCPVCCG